MMSKWRRRVLAHAIGLLVGLVLAYAIWGGWGGQ